MQIFPKEDANIQAKSSQYIWTFIQILTGIYWERGKLSKKDGCTLNVYCGWLYSEIDCCDMTEILLKVALNPNKSNKPSIVCLVLGLIYTSKGIVMRQNCWMFILAVA